MITTNETKTRLHLQQARVVVFVPEGLENLSGFARQISLLAAELGRAVVYVAVPRSKSDRLAAERQLTTLTALTQDGTMLASSQQAHCKDWMEALRQYARPGDVVVWPDAQLAVAADVEEYLDIHQVVLEGDWMPVEEPGQRRARLVITWAAVAAILAIFSYLEFALAGTAADPGLKKAVLVGLFALEVASFAVWDRLAG